MSATPPRLDGLSLLGSGTGAPGGMIWRGFSTAQDAALEPAFHSASLAELDHAAELARAAAPALAAASGADRGRLLRAIAQNLEANVAALAARAHLETSLPLARCEGEIARTCGQLRMFAETAERGAWGDARIETAQPERKPLPKPDHRSMLRALGPVAVFGASNFPFAFSTAGGDTASALAAGNPVIVKAHPAHPGTSELTARLVLDAVSQTGFPEGTFSLLFDAGHEIGAALVSHPAIQAVGFTGSQPGGLALMHLAGRRTIPIPVFAEMSAVNPVFLLPGALRERGDAIAAGLHQSVTLGVGQFCTNPGLVVVPRGADAAAFLVRLAAAFAGSSAEPMLTAGIHAAYEDGIARRLATSGVRVLARGAAGAAHRAEATLFATDAASFLRNCALAGEIFGPTTLAIECDDPAEMLAVARAMDGSLTATIHAGAGETCAEMLAGLAERAGRIVFNAFPTGVEVSSAMVHGGPFPATTDARSTSVGTRAIDRFARLVCYQGFPDAMLPPELQAANPRGVPRLVNGIASV